MVRDERNWGCRRMDLASRIPMQAGIALERRRYGWASGLDYGKSEKSILGQCAKTARKWPFWKGPKNFLTFFQIFLAELFALKKKMNIFVARNKNGLGRSSNGRTEVFGTFSQGSNPCRPTNLAHGLRSQNIFRYCYHLFGRGDCRASQKNIGCYYSHSISGRRDGAVLQ